MMPATNRAASSKKCRDTWNQCFCRRPLECMSRVVGSYGFSGGEKVTRNLSGHRAAARRNSVTQFFTGNRSGFTNQSTRKGLSNALVRSLRFREIGRANP